MNKSLEAKLKTLPTSSGVYFHKSANGEIIYVGKAAILKNRVRQYFQKVEDKDIKTQALVAEITDTDWIETESEIDALFLESEMVKRYKPRYNILLRDDKSQIFIRIDMKSDWPTVSFTRLPNDDKAEYFGPYFSAFAIKKALRYLRKVFPYYTKPSEREKGSKLDFQLGLVPNPVITSAQYKKSLRALVRYIKGERSQVVKELERDMKTAAKKQDFETAANLRNKLRWLSELNRRIVFGDSEFIDISKDQALSDLTELLGLPKVPVRIEGYDISHMSGTNVVASMVVFTNGVSDRASYRKFKTRQDRNDDFANMNETITRRFSPTNIKQWGMPDLLLIDGGKGQLDAAISALKVAGITTPAIGLAKRQEQIVIDYQQSSVSVNKSKLKDLGGYVESSQRFVLISLAHESHIIRLLQRIRDESHRFAVSYHTNLKRKGQITSPLDEIAGIGPATRKKLLKTFGSLNKVREASLVELEQAVGKSRAATIKSNLS